MGTTVKLLLTVCTLLVAVYGTCSSHVTAADEVALLVIAHPSLPQNRLSADELVAIFTLTQRRWPDGRSAIPFNYPPGNDIRAQFDRAVLRMDQVEVARFWIDRRVRGGGDSPRTVPSVALMERVIAALPGSIGYIPASASPAKVKVVARIVSGKIMPGAP